nr:DUF1571 domain-containing protein [uncultured Rhodoferax sp.]
MHIDPQRRSFLLCLALATGCTLALSAPQQQLDPSPDILRNQLLAMDQQAQGQWLAQAYATQQLERASDGQLRAILAAMHWSVLLVPAQQWLQANPDYEFSMFRRERLQTAEQLPANPERMWVRYRHVPRAVYARWQSGGPRSGQEILYDAKVDARTMRAHLGGLLGKFSFNVDIDGALARSQSRHTVRNMGFQYIFEQVEMDRNKLKARGLPEQAESSLVYEGTRRYVEVTLRTPGAPEFYAPLTRLRLDLSRPLLRMIECHDSEGQVFEHIMFDSVRPFAPEADAFAPSNPQFHF